MTCGNQVRPFALVICGVPAAGKSTLTAVAASVLGVSLVSSDLVRKELAGLSASDRALPGHYSDSFSRLVYAELGRRAAACAHARSGVIVDATFRRRRDRAAFVGAFGSAAPVLYAECHAPLRVLLGRAERRDGGGAPVSDATAEVVAREHGQWQPLDEIQAGHHVTICTDQAIALAAAELAAAIRNPSWQDERRGRPRACVTRPCCGEGVGW